MPILPNCATALKKLCGNIDDINGRDIATIVLQDPLMAVKMLSYIQPLSGKRLHSDIRRISSTPSWSGDQSLLRQHRHTADHETMLGKNPKAYSAFYAV